MPFAIIETGGKQYLVSPKDKIKIEKLAGLAGEDIVFDKVLFSSDGKSSKVGKPYVSGSQVVGTVVRQGRAKKISILKYKPKVRYRRRKGHRQEFTEVEIKSIA